MPYRTKRACSVCGRAVYGKCLDCERKRQRQLNAQRDGRESLYNSAWRTAVRIWRYDPQHRERLYCADPYRVHPVPKLATIVDHKIPHRGNPDKFWDMSNLQSLCKSCHDRKTAAEDGGFGNSSNSR